MLPAISEETGLPLERRIVQSSRAHHTHAKALEKFVQSAEFAGPVLPGKDYILLDDVVASGGTLVALRRYIRTHGGRVVATTALAAGDHPVSGAGRRLALQSETRGRLERLDVRQLNALLKEYGLADYHELTNSEANNLLAHGPIDAIRNRLAAARRRTANRAHADAVPAGQGATSRLGSLAKSFAALFRFIPARLRARPQPTRLILKAEG